jgi:hypothetical protein
MSVAIVYETHSTTLDNERGFATGGPPASHPPLAARTLLTSAGGERVMESTPSSR